MGREMGALMQQLMESVLAIGTNPTPDNGTGIIVYLVAINGDGFTVTLHIQLLQVRGQRTQIMVVRQNGVGIDAKKVNVPDAQQSHNDRHILRQWCSAEMLVHFVGAA